MHPLSAVSCCGLAHLVDEANKSGVGKFRVATVSEPQIQWIRVNEHPRHERIRASACQPFELPVLSQPPQPTSWRCWSRWNTKSSGCWSCLRRLLRSWFHLCLAELPDTNVWFKKDQNRQANSDRFPRPSLSTATMSQHVSTRPPS